MPYPPSLPPNNRTDTTPSFTNHPGDHNALVDALAAIIAELGNNPSGAAADVTQLIAMLAPVGVISMYSMPAAPSGWLLCDGAAVPRATYPALNTLYQAAGYPYGAGNGSTTFNVPDMTGRFPVGRNAGDALFDTVNDFGGSKDAVVVPHDHAIDHDHPSQPFLSRAGEAAHAHGPGAGQTFFTRTAGGGALGVQAVNVGEQWFNPATTAADGHHQHWTDVDLSAFAGRSGGASGAVSGANANLPPFRTLAFIVKAA